MKAKPLTIPPAASTARLSFVQAIVYRGRQYCRWLDHSAAFLELLRSTSVSPRISRALDDLAADWLTATPGRQESTARYVLAPRFLVPDVFARACKLSTVTANRKAAQLVSDHLTDFDDLIAVDSFIDSNGEYRQCLTLRGVDGVNTLLLLLSRHFAKIQGIWQGIQLSKRIAPLVASHSTPEAVAAFVKEVTDACKARLARFDSSKPGITLNDLMIREG